LFDLLSNSVINKRRIPILIACNKQDLLTAYKAQSVRSLLEKEIEKLRHTRSTVPSQQEESGSSAEDMSIGLEGEEFSMDHLELPVSFAEISAKDGNIQKVVTFVEGHM